MDFIDQLKQFSTRIAKMKDSIQTEEATKTSMIMPFFQMLGYDVFNPLEFVPEYTADVGIKKGEKVDYAIMDEDQNPLILIEAKCHNFSVILALLLRSLAFLRMASSTVSTLTSNRQTKWMIALSLSSIFWT